MSQEIPQYTLDDAVGWLTTRQVPLSQSGCDSILAIINNTSDFQEFTPYFAGLTSENSQSFLYSFGRPGDKFRNIIKAIYVPTTLYIALMYIDINRQYLLDARTIQSLFDCIQMTPEFRPFLEQLEGITPENSNTYNKVFNQLMNLPLFLINSQKFVLTEEKND